MMMLLFGRLWVHPSINASTAVDINAVGVNGLADVFVFIITDTVTAAVPH